MLHASPLDQSVSLKYRYRESSPSNMDDCAMTPSSDSDSDVSVDDDDDVDEERDAGCATVPDGPTAASRLRLIVASEEKRRHRTNVELATETTNQTQSDQQLQGRHKTPQK